MLTRLNRLLQTFRRGWHGAGSRASSDAPHAYSRQLAQFIEHVRDYAIFLLDKQGRVITWNAGAQRIKGYRADEIIGQHFSRFYPPEAIARGWPEHELAVAAKTGRFEDEGWRVRKDGSQFWANVIITADRDETGAVRGFIKITRDLSDRKLAEENSQRIIQQEAEKAAIEAQAATLHQQREELQVTLTSIGDAVIVTDMDGRVTFMNPVATELTGWDIADAAGRPIEEVFRIVNETTRQIVESPVRRVLREGIVVGLANHTVLLSRDGREIPIDDSGAPIRGSTGELSGVVLVFRDITLARQALNDRMQLAAIVESSNDAIIGEDLQGNITSWNRAAEILYGYSAEEIIGQPLSQLVPPDQPDEVPAILERIQRGERVNHFETSRIRKDGQRIAVSLTVSPIRNAENEIVGASKIARDITAQREEARRKNEFLALLAHELRNPLVPLHNGLHLMKLGMRSPETLEPLRQMMDRQVQQLTHLVEDLLDLNRISTGKMRLHPELLVLSEILHAALESCQHAFEERHHQLTLSIPPEPLLVHADRTRLSQVFVNVLLNAARYTHQNGQISLTVQRENSHVLIRIRDNGIGIPAAMLGRVFELFAQLEQTDEKYNNGLGVGLHIVQRVLELHGGRIDAYSEGPGRGSEFVIQLPLATLEKSDPELNSPVVLKPASTRRRVLVVDDNIDAAESLAQLLTALGHDSRMAHDGLEGLAVANDFRPQLIFLDLGMPGLNGFQTCQQLRQQSWGAKVTIYALSGWDQSEYRIRSAEAGFNGHLVKPAGLQTLLEILENLPAGRT